MKGQDTELLPSLDIVYNETREALDRQFEQSSSLDMKLGVSLGLSGVILAALLSFPLIRNGDMVTKWLLIGAVTLVLVSLSLAAIGGYWIRRFEWAPQPGALHEFYLAEQPELTKRAVLAVRLSVYDRNRKRILLKARFMYFSFVFILSGALVIGVTLLYNLL